MPMKENRALFREVSRADSSPPARSSFSPAKMRPPMEIKKRTNTKNFSVERVEEKILIPRSTFSGVSLTSSSINWAKVREGAVIVVVIRVIIFFSLVFNFG